MYRRSLVFILFLLGQLSAQGSWQAVTVSDTVVSFGQVLCGQQHSISLTLQNNLDEPVNILSAVFEENEFTTDLSPLEIPANGSRDFHIYFESNQNVNFTDFLQISLDKGIHALIVDASAEAVYENSYYDNTQNLWGADLKSALHNIIDNHTELSYSGVWDALKNTDEDPNNSNNVILLYTGWSYKKSEQNTGDQNGWNREHVWAKSHGDFGTSAPAGTDIHHLRPADVTVNSKRGSLDFDNGGTLYTDDDGPTECRYDNDSWEPRDEVKGDVARMMYYMVVRYEGDDTSYDLELVDYIPSSPGNEPLFGKQSTLYQWHQQDSVSDWERRRNDRIDANWQHNRNPFIDYPQFAARMPSVSGEALVEEPEIAVAPLSVDMGEIPFTTRAVYSIALINTGNQTLDISSIQSTNTDFTVDKSSMSLTPEEYDYVSVSFTSQAIEGTFSTTIQISSNDPDESLLEIPVTVQVKNGTSVVEKPSFAETYELSQNYPNPFNPSTQIHYQLAMAGRVELVVYNASGQRMRTLVEQEQSVGGHMAVFDSRGLSSGVYFYRLTVNSHSGYFEKTRKMILMR